MRSELRSIIHSPIDDGSYAVTDSLCAVPIKDAAMSYGFLA